MTRESRARWLVFITAALVVLLAALFSVLRNWPGPQSAAAGAPGPGLAAGPTADAAAPAQAPAAASAAAAAPAHGASPAIASTAPEPIAPSTVAGTAAPVVPIEPRARQPQIVAEPPPSSGSASVPAPQATGAQGSPNADARPLPPAGAAPAAPAPVPEPSAAPAAAPSQEARVIADGSAAAHAAARIAAGERAYARLGCATCHSIAGRGKPSSPLDGVGNRLDRQALLEFTTGTGAARDALGAGLARRKARAIDDPDLDALIDYLAQLK
jgi:hypothetical protein